MAGSHRNRAITAADGLLKANGSVNLLDVFAEIGWLSRAHLRRWEKGEIDDLFSQIASTRERRIDVVHHFAAWATQTDLKGIDSRKKVRTRDGARELVVMPGAPAELEAVFHRQYVSPDASVRKQMSVKKKAEKAPDLVVFIKQGRNDTECSECGIEIHRRQIFVTEDKQAFCLKCADLDHLEFLPSGHATLSRRARKYSPLNAIVVEWSRRKRYERRGILVIPEAIEKAEAECLEDADLREARRVRSQERRHQKDEEYRLAMVEKIAELYPGCPKDEVEAIAMHTTVRGSDRVGRTAAAKEFDVDAIRHAVAAHIRHIHTRYDSMLMGGTPRQAARQRIREKVGDILEQWQQR